MGANLVAGGATFNKADARFTFTQQTLPGANPWSVNINGPLQTLVVPEPSSMMTGIACLWPVIGSFLARRRKAGPREVLTTK